MPDREKIIRGRRTRALGALKQRRDKDGMLLMTPEEAKVLAKWIEEMKEKIETLEEIIAIKEERIAIMMEGQEIGE